jgi:hypothetical protein
MVATGFYAFYWHRGFFFLVLWGMLVFGFFRARKIFVRTVDRVFLTSGAVVALTTAGFPYVTGYGTNLFQLVVLGAWSLIARLSSGMFADQHHGILYLLALLLNLVGFSLPAIPVWLLSRNRTPKLGSFVIVGWTLFYATMLFFLFPATDGP